MVHLNVRHTFRLGNCPRNFENAIIAASREVELRDCRFEQILCPAVHIAELLKRLRVHVRVAPNATAFHSTNLFLSRCHDSTTNLRGVLPGAFAHQLFGRQTGHFDMDVDSVQQRPRNLRQVASDLRGRANPKWGKWKKGSERRGFKRKFEALGSTTRSDMGNAVQVHPLRMSYRVGSKSGNVTRSSKVEFEL
ncbi:hypothetical protein IAD21_00184 [Abditibacteriota bacterium]|nr:hypothetical protein IAD21_00184 [Abditibacteriota bacterium]